VGPSPLPISALAGRTRSLAGHEARSPRVWATEARVEAMLPSDEVEAQQQFPALGITLSDIYRFGILGALSSFHVSPKSVTLRARILLV